MANVAISLAINVAANYLLTITSTLPTREQGKVNDLHVTGSSYGVEIPQIFGRARIGGNIIWSTDLIEHESDQHSGGKGHPNQTTKNYSYTVSMAVALCRGPIASVLRIWGEDLLIYDATQTPAFAVGLATAITPYLGDETQNADPTIQSYAGAAYTPAYRGTAYVVFENLVLDHWGGRIPQLTFEIDAGAATLETILDSLASQCGLISGTDFDFSAVSGVDVTGFVASQRRATGELLLPLLKVYLADLAEVDGKLIAVPRGGAAAATVPWDDLGAHEWSGSEDQALVRVEARRAQDIDLPQRIDLRYFASTRQYEQASQSAIRQAKTGLTQSQVTLDTGLVLVDDDARQFAERVLYDEWLNRSTFSYALGPKYLAIAPTDVLLLPVSQSDANGVKLTRVRVTQVDAATPGEIRFQGVLDDPNILIQSALSGTVAAPATPASAVAPTSFLAWSGTEIQDADRTADGFYVAATGPSGWSGATIYYSSDSGGTWVTAGTVTGKSVIGQTLTALPDATDPTIWDRSSTLSVGLLVTGSLTSASESLVLSSTTNAAMVGGEIVSFATATQFDTLSYNLTTFRRGERSSPMTSHVIGDQFVLLSASVVRIAVPASLVSTSVIVKCVASGEDFTSAPVISVQIAARTLTVAEQAAAAAQTTANTAQTTATTAQTTATAAQTAATTVFSASGTGHHAGIVPDPGATAGTARYLREDATWATPSGGGGGGVTSVNTRTGAIILTGADVPAFVGSGTGHAAGAVPDPGATAGTTRYLREDGTWHAPPGGSSGIPWLPTLVTPNAGDTAWVNQGSATLAAQSGGVFLFSLSIGSSGDSLNMRTMALPSTPYTLDIAFLPMARGFSGVAPYMGIVIRDGSSGNLLTWHVQPSSPSNGGPVVGLSKWSSATALSSSVTTESLALVGPLVWLRIVDSGSRYDCFISNDGVNWQEPYGDTRSALLASPTQIGYFCDARNPYVGAGMTLVHWSVH